MRMAEGVRNGGECDGDNSGLVNIIHRFTPHLSKSALGEMIFLVLFSLRRLALAADGQNSVFELDMNILFPHARQVLRAQQSRSVNQRLKKRARAVRSIGRNSPHES